MTKIEKLDKSTRKVVTVKTKESAMNKAQGFTWWTAKSKRELASQVIDTVAFLKEQQNYRVRQASIHARMYGNIPLANFAGSTLGKLNTNNALPVDRPTMNVVQSCIDTLVSRITQSRPLPQFLTDNGDHRQRTLAKQLNGFIAGELYQTKAYEKAEAMLRDASILGTGCVKVYETDDKKVGLERVLITELFVDSNDGFYGSPRSMYHTKLVDRAVAKELLPEEKSKIESAEQAFPDNSNDSQKTASDQIMMVEAWHLPSSKEAGDGRHVIACSSGTLLDEPYEQDKFPFVFVNYAPRLVGFWAQGLAEQLTGTQVEINKLLITISQSISLVGVPRVFVEDGSKVVKAHLNNQVGSIVTYRGTKPEYEVAPCVPQELYAQLQRLIEYAYQQSGISSLAATSQKPAGLDSGKALREYDDLQTDRFSVIEKRYHNAFIDLSYLIVHMAKDIAERDGSYQTVYPNKNGAKEIKLPDAKLLEDPFVIQCYDSSALPRDPAARKQAVIEDMQAGILSLQEGRRLLNYPDLEQVDKLEMAAEERILQILDEIVEDGKYTPPDPYIDIMLAKKLVVQYYNLYVPAKLSEKNAELLRNWQSQLLMLEMASMPPAPPPMPNSEQPTQAVPEAQPTSPMLPQV